MGVTIIKKLTQDVQYLFNFQFECILHKTDLAPKYAKYCLELSKQYTTEKEHKESINDTLIELIRVYNEKQAKIR